MKRYLTIILSTSLVFILLACSEATDTPPQPQPPAEPSPIAAIDWKAAYYRIGWRDDIEGTARIRSVKELREYYDKTQPEDINGIIDEVFFNDEQYNDVFFAEHLLFLITASEGSGSVRHKVTSLSEDGGVLRVHIDKLIPEIGTADMAGWIIVIEADRSFLETEIDVVWTDVQM